MEQCDEELARNYKFPRNDGPIEGADGHARITGPCGDTMEFWLLVREGTIARVSFVTDGCFTSHGCGCIAALLSEKQTVEAAADLGQEKILAAFEEGLPAESEHCALLAANTLKAACEDYLRTNGRRGKEKTDGLV
ncbi:MAG: iron-sulfur cluster assembly scaffold protein [Deltaproteobacteria bacterium]|nr:iron-sulfur cluster assembly scaffold protein [Deltaproteobacteria bacterium]